MNRTFRIPNTFYLSPSLNWRWRMSSLLALMLCFQNKGSCAFASTFKNKCLNSNGFYLGTAGVYVDQLTESGPGFLDSLLHFSQYLGKTWSQLTKKQDPSGSLRIRVCLKHTQYFLSSAVHGQLFLTSWWWWWRPFEWSFYFKTYFYLTFSVENPSVQHATMMTIIKVWWFKQE